MTKLVLHIGTTKTGTTAIQEFLAANQAALAEQGVGYPLSTHRFARAAISRNAHFLHRKFMLDHGLSERTAVDDCAMSAAEEAFAQALQRFDTVVLSDEVFWTGGFRKGFWAHVKGYCDAAGVTDYQIVVYLRRQDLYTESRWNQFVKQRDGRTFTFKEFLCSKNALKVADYYRGLQRAAKVFGKENITVGVFERERLANGDVVPDFLDEVGIKLTDAFERPPGELNQRLSGNLVEAKRIINESANYRAVGKNFLRDSLVAASQCSGETGKTSPLDVKERKDYLKRFEDGNAKIAREYLGRANGALFGAASSDDAPVWRYNTESMLHDTILLFTEALCAERQCRAKLERRIAKLEDQVEQLKAQAEDEQAGR